MGFVKPGRRRGEKFGGSSVGEPNGERRLATGFGDSRIFSSASRAAASASASCASSFRLSTFVSWKVPEAVISAAPSVVVFGDVGPFASDASGINPPRRAISAATSAAASAAPAASAISRAASSAFSNAISLLFSRRSFGRRGERVGVPAVSRAVRSVAVASGKPNFERWPLGTWRYSRSKIGNRLLGASSGASGPSRARAAAAVSPGVAKWITRACLGGVLAEAAAFSRAGGIASTGSHAGNAAASAAGGFGGTHAGFGGVIPALSSDGLPSAKRAKSASTSASVGVLTCACAALSRARRERFDESVLEASKTAPAPCAEVSRRAFWNARFARIASPSASPPVPLRMDRR